MRSLIFLFFTAGLVLAQAAEPFIPEKLNAVLGEIRPGMRKAAVQRVLATAYPKVKESIGEWAGQSGSISFILDETYSISISMVFDAKREEVVGPSFSITNKARGRGIQVRHFSWGANEKKD